MTAYDDDAGELGEDCEQCGLTNLRCRCGDTESTDDPVCPHCFHQHHDTFEWPQDEDGTSWCDACGKEFNWAKHIQVSWTTRPPKTTGEPK